MRYKRPRAFHFDSREASCLRQDPARLGAPRARAPDVGRGDVSRCAGGLDWLAARGASRGGYLGSGLLALAREAGAIAIDEEYPRGLNVAVGLATEALISAGATEVCTVLSDIPLVTARDIDEVFAALAPGRGAVLVPSRDFTGTNIIARSPAGVIPTMFGRMSLVKHLDECRRASGAVRNHPSNGTRARSGFARRPDRICAHRGADQYAQSTGSAGPRLKLKSS